MARMAPNRGITVDLCALVLCLEFLLVTLASPAPSPGPPSQSLSPSIPVSAPGVAALPTVPAPTPAAIPVAAPSGVEPQVTNMLEALRGAGQFGAIAGLLDGLQMKNLTPMTTWLLPSDEAFSGTNYPKNVTMFIDYHVIRELLPFSRLGTLSLGTRLPTFLGTDTVVVTSNLRFNYSLDNAMIVVPDLYTDSTVAVHGIDAILNAAVYNGGAPVPAPGSPAPSVAPAGVPSDSPTTNSPSTSSQGTDSPRVPPGDFSAAHIFTPSTECYLALYSAIMVAAVYLI